MTSYCAISLFLTYKLMAMQAIYRMFHRYRVELLTLSAAYRLGWKSTGVAGRSAVIGLLTVLAIANTPWGSVMLESKAGQPVSVGASASQQGLLQLYHHEENCERCLVSDSPYVAQDRASYVFMINPHVRVTGIRG